MKIKKNINSIYFLSQGGFENLDIARLYFCQSYKLNPKNIRSLYGIFLVSILISTIICKFIYIVTSNNFIKNLN